MTIDLQNLFAGCAGMEAGTEDLSKYAEAAAKRDALEEKLKALQAEYEAAKKDVENIEQERAAALRKRERAEADGVIETVEERYARLLWYLGKLFKNPRAKPGGTKMFCSAFLNDARMCCFLPMQ